MTVTPPSASDGLIADALDLSRIAGLEPEVVVSPSYEAIFAERLVRLRDELAAAGIPWDVGGLETDPAAVVQQVDAYRELLDRRYVNDVYRSLLAAIADGAELDLVVANRGLRRLVVTAATSSSAAVMESDDSLRTRYFASFYTQAAGSKPAMIFHARTALPSLRHVAVWGLEDHGVPGLTQVVVLPAMGASITDAQMVAVVRACTAPHVRPATGPVQVMQATPVTYAVAGTITIPRGPDPAVVLAEAIKSVTAFASDRYRIAGEAPVALIAGAAGVGGVIRVDLTSPSADVVTTRLQAPVCTGIALDLVVRG